MLVNKYDKLSNKEKVQLRLVFCFFTTIPTRLWILLFFS